MRDVLISMYLKYDGDYSAIYKALKEKEPFPSNVINGFKDRFNFEDYRTIVDNEYPNYFKECMNPPIVYEIALENIILHNYKAREENFLA